MFQHTEIPFSIDVSIDEFQYSVGKQDKNVDELVQKLAAGLDDDLPAEIEIKPVIETEQREIGVMSGEMTLQASISTQNPELIDFSVSPLVLEDKKRNLTVEVKTPLLAQGSLTDTSIHFGGVAKLISPSEEHSYLASLSLTRSGRAYTATIMLHGADLSVLLVGSGGLAVFLVAAVTPPSLCKCFRFVRWLEFKKTVKDPEPPDLDRFWFFTPSKGIATWREFDFYEAEYDEVIYSCDHFDQGPVAINTLKGVFAKEARDMSAPLTYRVSLTVRGPGPRPGSLIPIPRVVTKISKGPSSTVKKLEVDESDYPWKDDECPS